MLCPSGGNGPGVWQAPCARSQVFQLSKNARKMEIQARDLGLPSQFWVGQSWGDLYRKVTGTLGCGLIIEDDLVGFAAIA